MLGCAWRRVCARVGAAPAPTSTATSATRRAARWARQGWIVACWTLVACAPHVPDAASPRRSAGSEPSRSAAPTAPAGALGAPAQGGALAQVRRDLASPPAPLAAFASVVVAREPGTRGLTQHVRVGPLADLGPATRRRLAHFDARPARDGLWCATWVDDRGQTRARQCARPQDHAHLPPEGTRDPAPPRAASAAGSDGDRGSGRAHARSEVGASTPAPGVARIRLQVEGAGTVTVSDGRTIAQVRVTPAVSERGDR